MSHIKACVKCFGKNIQRDSLKTSKNISEDSETDYFPLVIDWVCADCGYRGVPIVFCSEEDYVNFMDVNEKNNKVLHRVR